MHLLVLGKALRWHWVPEDPSEDKGKYITKALKSDGTDVQMEAFANAVSENKSIPGNAEHGYYAGVATLLGDQAMMERRMIQWPEELMLS